MSDVDERAPRARDGVLIGADDLAALLGAGPVTLLDVRWALGDPHGRDHYRAAHLPGAVFVDLEADLAAPGSAAEGRHPLPELAALQDAARRWGVRAGVPVVAYDATGGLAAARAWWLLRWGGVAGVRLLDGGLAAWTAAGHPTEPGDVVAEPGDVVLTAGGMPVVGIDEVAVLAADGTAVVLDARAGERYRGEAEPIDPKAGHVPGAVSAPTTENLGADLRFLDDAVLRERFSALGVTEGAPVAVYCGSGVTAAHEIAALAVAGVEAALYPGSWSQWSHDPSRPVATARDPRSGAVLPH